MLRKLCGRAGRWLLELFFPDLLNELSRLGVKSWGQSSPGAIPSLMELRNELIELRKTRRDVHNPEMLQAVYEYCKGIDARTPAPSGPAIGRADVEEIAEIAALRAVRLFDMENAVDRAADPTFTARKVPVKRARKEK